MNRAEPRIVPPSELKLDSDTESNFTMFKRRCESYYVLSQLGDESDEYQRALLLYSMGSDVRRVVESSTSFQTEKSCTAILKISKQFCVGEKNVIQDRYLFNTRSQLPG